MTTLMQQRINKFAKDYAFYMPRMTNAELVAKFGHSIEFWTEVRKVVDNQNSSAQAGAWHTGYLSR